jgi:DNA-binding CsgD family transcriptional regulator
MGSDLSRLVAALDEPPGAVAPKALLSLIRDALLLQNVAYLALHAPPLTRDGPYIEVTYSPEWVAHYRKNGYVSYDPTLTEPTKSILPTDWSKLDRTHSVTKRLFHDAELFAVGNQGITVPIRGVNNERAFFSVTKNCDADTWRAFKKEMMPLITVAAQVFHETVMKIHGIKYPKIDLTIRESEVLGWAAAGKSASDISVILNISVHTARTHLDTARHKLGALNITHAVRRAIQLNLIVPPE